MMWKGRAPLQHIYSHGSIKFKKVHGELFYQLAIWSDSGLQFINNQKIKVPDGSFIEDIKLCKTLKDVHKIIEQHSQSKVITK